MKMRFVVVGLTLSLALNAFLLGYGLTLLNQRPPQRLLEPTPMELGQRIADLLPTEAGDRIRAAVRDAGPQIARHLVAYRRSLAQGAELLGQETVDRAALQQVVIAARDARSAIGDVLTGVLVETAAELPLEARRELIRRANLQRGEGNP